MLKRCLDKNRNMVKLQIISGIYSKNEDSAVKNVKMYKTYIIRYVQICICTYHL